VGALLIYPERTIAPNLSKRLKKIIVPISNVWNHFYFLAKLSLNLMSFL